MATSCWRPTRPSSNRRRTLFEFNPTSSTYSDVTPSVAGLSGTSAYQTRMLMLPSGQVLFTSGAQENCGCIPRAVCSTRLEADDRGHRGQRIQLRAVRDAAQRDLAGASYGDDAEMDTNYPIVELKSGSGTISFARTYGWSSTVVATGVKPVSTNFSLPPNLPHGTYSCSSSPTASPSSRSRSPIPRVRPCPRSAPAGGVGAATSAVVGSFALSPGVTNDPGAAARNETAGGSRASLSRSRSARRPRARHHLDGLSPGDRFCEPGGFGVGVRPPRRSRDG